MQDKTLKFNKNATILSAASVVGAHEHEGPLGDFFENKYFLPFSPDYKEDNNSNFYQFFAYKMIDNIPTLVGTLLINHCLRFEFQDYIEYLVVNPHYQNRGIGTQMLSSILQNPSNFTNSENPKNLVGYIHCDNIPSLKLVKKLGFKEFTYPHFDDYNYLYSTSYLAFIYNVKEMNSDRTKN